MKIRYKVELEDVIAFNQYHWETSPGVRRMRFGIIAIFCSIFAAFGFYDAFKQHSIFPLLSQGFLAVVCVVFLNRVGGVVNRKMVARIHSEGKNKGLLCEHEMEILPDGFIEKTSVNETKQAFTSIERIETTDTHAFIFIGPAMGHVIPKSKVSEGDLDTFLSELKEKISAS